MVTVFSNKVPESVFDVLSALRQQISRLMQVGVCLALLDWCLIRRREAVVLSTCCSFLTITPPTHSFPRSLLVCTGMQRRGKSNHPFRKERRLSVLFLFPFSHTYNPDRPSGCCSLFACKCEQHLREEEERGNNDREEREQTGSAVQTCC